MNPAPPRTTALNELLGILQAVADDPRGMRPIAADWLDTHVEPEKPDNHMCGRFPGWFAKNWRRNLKAAHPGHRSVRSEVNKLVTGGLLDHWGTVRIFGVAALLSEPYFGLGKPNLDDTLDAVGLLTESVGVWARRSAWNPPSTCRLLWLPHPERFDQAMAGMGNKTFGW